MNKYKSPYSAAITGGGFLLSELLALLPLLQSNNSAHLLKDESIHNRIININAETSRKRVMAEIIRRYNAMPSSFWVDFQEMEEKDMQVALFLVILKTYKILFDLHLGITLHKWNSVFKSVTIEDIMIGLDEISIKDDFVDSWSIATKKKVASSYITILHKIGMLDTNENLCPLICNNFGYYITHGESWFLEACLLYPYQIEKIKQALYDH